MARVSTKGKGRGGFTKGSKRTRAFKAYIKRVNRTIDLVRKS